MHIHINWLTRVIRHNLDKVTTKILIQALVLSKLDYWNSLLVGSVEYQLDKLQCIQNMACRVVCKLCKYDYIPGYMSDLHLLQVCEHIKYKLAVIMLRMKTTSHPFTSRNFSHPQNSPRYIRPSVSDYITPAFWKASLTQNSSFGSCHAYGIHYLWTFATSSPWRTSRANLRHTSSRNHTIRCLVSSLSEAHTRFHWANIYIDVVTKYKNVQ